MTRNSPFTLLALILALALSFGCASRASKPAALAGGPPPTDAPLVGESTNLDSGEEEATELSSPASPDFGPSDSGRAAEEKSERAASAAPSALRPRAEARPGLGTHWGETRDSHAMFAHFVRARSERPFVVSRVFYNDRSGISAMADAGRARDFGDGGRSAFDGPLTIRLLDADGNALPHFEVASRDYVVGQVGDRYIIELTNHTGSRFEAVATVDGLDVVDGRPGSFSKRGYILEPFATLTIDGFRQSLDSVAAFRFGRVARSYASLKGMPRNVGVIGVAFFEEMGSEPFLSSEEIRLRHTADPFPDRFASPPRGR